jgi:hypothetical protein
MKSVGKQTYYKRGEGVGDVMRRSTGAGAQTALIMPTLGRTGRR